MRAVLVINDMAWLYEMVGASSVPTAVGSCRIETRFTSRDTSLMAMSGWVLFYTRHDFRGGGAL